MSLTGKGQAVTGQVENAMRTWVTIISRGVRQADLDTVDVVFDQFYLNAQDYFISKEE